MSLSPQKSFFYIGEKMPSSIVPIDRTRDYSVKPLSGLRYGNFDGEVYLPPINKGSKIGQHSLSYLNNQQIYNKVCDWYETWRPWQQCVLLCGIVNRCSIRQLDILSTSLEPVKHRDYRTAYKCHYPSTPFRKQRQSSPLSLPPLPISRGSRGLSLFGDEDTPGFSESRNKVDNSGYYQLNNPVQTLELPSPEGGMTDYTPSVTPLDPAEEAKLKRSRLELAHDYAVFTEPVKEKTLNAGTVHKFADKLSKNILDSVLKRDQYDSETEESSRSESVDPKLIYSVEKPSSQFKEAPPPQQRKKKKKSKLFKSKPATIRESSREGIVSPWKESTNITKKTKSSMSVIDVQHQNVSEAKRKEHEPTKSTSRPISTVHIVTPYNHIPQSRQSEPSRLSRRSISFVRYQMFGSMMVSTPDFFPEKETKKGPMQREVKFERSARFKRFRGVAQSLPVPLQRLYKGHKWWPNMPHDGTKFVKASKNDLLTNFKMQLQEIYKWLSQWESYEKINLMNVILKISGPDALNFLMNYIQQRLVDARDVNRLSDKLMLYIFSFLDPEEIMMAAQVCRKWRYLCATDQLWMIKCHELGISEGIENMEDIVNRANTYSMGIDWKLAYRELKELTEVVKKAKLREIAEEEAENRRHEEELRKRKRKPSISLEIDVKRGTVHEIKEEKRMRKLKREEMRAKGQEVETSDSDLSTEDLREYDDYVFQSTEDQPFIRRSKAPYQWKRIYGHETSAAFPPQIPERTRTEIEMGLEKTIKSDEMKFKMKKEETTVENLKAKLREKTPRKKSEPKEKAYDIRTELRQAIDILGKSLPSMRLEWRKPETFDDKTSIKSGSTATTMTGRYMGVVKSVRRVRKFQGHMNGVLCIQYDRKRLISAGLDRTIRIWDIRSGQSIHKFYGHKGGIRCLQFEGNTLVTGSWDTTIMVWDLKEFELTNMLSDHTGCVSCLQMNDEYIVSGSHDMTVRVWFRCTCTQFKVLRGHKGPINCVCLDDDVVISGSSDGCIRMVEILSGLCVRTFHGKQEHILSLSVQGDLILSGDIQGCVFFWNKATGDCEAAIQAHSAPINKVVYHQGRFTTASSDYTIREWDLMTMTCVRALQGHLGAVRDVKVSDDRIVSCSDDGTIRIWDFLNTKPSKTVADDVENTADNSS